MGMSNWVLWMVLSRLTGSPIGSAVAIIAFWFVADRYTLGVLPDPFLPFLRWRRRQKLETNLAHNPHDGTARLELAQAYVDRGDGKKAVEVLRPNFDRGADDLPSVFLMGHACALAGYTEQGEKLLAHAEEMDADFRVGELYLIRGRARLARKDFAGAKADLTHLLKLRSGTVEGRYLLAQAIAGLGDDGAAALMLDEAWKEFEHAPRFQRRKERLWAWRAKPSRPAMYLVVALLVLITCAKVVGPQIQAMQPSEPDTMGDYDE